MNELLRTPIDMSDLSHIWRTNSKTKGMTPPLAVEYDRVMRCRSIESLYGSKMNNAIILFYPGVQHESGDVDGHYTAMIRHPDSIHFYDPYGFTPDMARRWSDERLYVGSESLLKLMRKLYQKGEWVDYSHYPHQSKTPQISTCGRHCLTRCLFSNLTNDEYDTEIRRIAKHHHCSDLDELVCRIWPIV